MLLLKPGSGQSRWRARGLVNFFGGPPSGTSVSLDTNLIHYSDLTLKASFHHTPSTVRRAFDLLASGRFQCQDFLTGTANLEDLPNVFRRMLTRSADGVAPEIKTAIFPNSAPQPSASQPLAVVEESA